MTFKGIHDIIPDGQIELLERGRTEEVEQGLFDLGYLEKNDSISKAIVQFRTDYRAANLLLDRRRQPLYFQQPELDPVELNLLHKLIALDGDFLITQLPIFGTSNLTTRVIHYRLETLGLYLHDISSVFDEMAVFALHQLADWLRLSKDLLSLVQLVGNIPALIKAVTDGELLKEHIVCFTYHSPTNEQLLLAEISEETEEHDDETALEAQEAKIDASLKALEKKISSKEQAVIEDFEVRDKTQRRRQKQIDRLRKRIDRTLQEQKVVFQKRLKKRKQEDNSLQQLQKLIDKLNQDNQHFQTTIQEKQAQLKLVEESLKITEKAQQNIQDLKKKCKKKYKNLSKAALQLQIDKQNQTCELHDRQIAKLNELLTKLERKKRRQVQLQLDHINRQQKTATKLLAEQRQEWVLRNAIDENLIRIKGIQNEFATRTKLINEVAHLQARFLVKETEIKEITHRKNRSKRNNDQFLAKIKLEQQRHQLEIQTYQKELHQLLQAINNLSFRFKAKLRRSLTPSYYQEIKREVFTNRNINYLNTRVANPFNQFLIRLIQVHQWTNGYYYGKLDSELRHRSFDSIADLVEDIPRLRLKYILTLLGSQTKGYWILNVHYLFDRLRKLLEEDTKKYTAADVFKAYEKKMDKKRHKVTVVEEAWKVYTEEIKDGLRQPSKIRRIYYGIRSLARSIMRCFARLIRFIIRGLKKLITLFKNFIKLLYKEIREGVRKFKEGVGFLFGTRQLETTDPVTGKIILTKYDFDFDTTIISPTQLPEAIYWQHHRKCIRYTRNLDFSMVLLGKILNWVWTIVRGPFGWAKLAIRIAIYFKNLVIQWLKRKRRTLRIVTTLILD